jgi:hypothetical protein
MKEHIALLKGFPVQRPQQSKVVPGGLLRAVGVGVIDQEGVGVEDDLLARGASPEAQVDVVKVGEKAIVESA